MTVSSEMYARVLEAFNRAGNCVKRLTVDIGGCKVTFARDHTNIGIVG